MRVPSFTDHVERLLGEIEALVADAYQQARHWEIGLRDGIDMKATLFLIATIVCGSGDYMIDFSPKLSACELRGLDRPSASIGRLCNRLFSRPLW